MFIDLILSFQKLFWIECLETRYVFFSCFNFNLIFSTSTKVTRNRSSGNTDRTGHSTHLCWEPSYTRTYSSLPGIKMETNQRSEHRGLFMDSYSYLFNKLLSVFFSFLCQDANKTRSNCSIIGCNLSKKHKLTLYKTQNGESNYVDHKFFFNFYQELPPVQSLGDRHPNTIELPSWLVHVLCDFKATWYQEAYFSVSWIHHGTTSCWYPYLPFWGKSSLHLLGIVWVFIYIYFLLFLLPDQNW